MSLLPLRSGAPIDEAAYRRSLGLPAMAAPAPDAARLNRIADEALRTLRRVAVVPEAGFAWLLAPRVAAGLLAMALAGGIAGAGWPVTASGSAATSDVVALLDIPLPAPVGVSP